MAKFMIFCALVLSFGQSETLELRNRAYEDLVVKIAENVPSHDCRKILDNLQASLISASQYLFSALDSRVYLRSATVLLPSTWHDSCAPSAVISASGETSDVSVVPQGPSRGHMWTQQSLGCGQPGDQIYMSYESLLKKDNTLGRTFVKEFAMYRYGVFEEQGYFNDPIYPMCYYDDVKKQAKVTGCSDSEINDYGLCSGESGAIYNTTKMVSENARSSIMFAPEAPSVSLFCDDGIHDKIAPTKHNLICQRSSVLDVILRHSDFDSKNVANNAGTNQITDTTPKITYKRQKLTRYVFVIENTKNMLQRESWSLMRLAIRQWSINVLTNNTEVGLVLTDDVASTKALEMISMRYRDGSIEKFYSAIPYTPGESMKSGCLRCGLKDAMSMLNQRTKTDGAANNVIVVIAAGMNEDQQLMGVLGEIKKSKIKIAAITYPTIVRNNTLDILATETDGVSYTIFEKKLNVETTLLSTYFELHNVFYDMFTKYYSGSQADLLMEIHRREIVDDGRTSVTGSFMLDPNMGEPAKFILFTHNSIAPLIKSIKLISPSHQVFTTRSDRDLDFKMISLIANISEPGTWTYTVEPYSGNPQPHFLQIMATPKSPMVPVLRAKFWMHRNQPGDPLVLLTEVKIGEMPVLGAKVEVSVTKTNENESLTHRHKFELLDTGSGDPDITRGDGVYTRYYSAAAWGPGLYTFEVTVTDNGNTAYSWTESSRISDDKPCCGSIIPSNGVQPIAPFQRVLPKRTIQISSDEIVSASQVTAGRIGDLKVEIMPDDMKARLSWTAPDMGGHNVARYEVKYATSAVEIMEQFETSAKVWNNGQPFPLAPGSETTFTLDMSANKEMLDKVWYFAVKAYPKMSSDSTATISNWVRVLVPSPPPPPTVAPSYTDHDPGYWPNNPNYGTDDINGNPSVSKAMGIGLELILPIAIGFILLVILLVLYCYFCVVKRREHPHGKPTKTINGDKINSTITIVPSSPQNTPTPTYTTEVADPHVVGVPINNYAYEEETKKRYSLVNQQEQQLIEELKQQQQMAQRENHYGGISVISNSLTRNGGHTLSPYNSWSASQLLHEHERRHSPLDNMIPEDHMILNGSQIDHMSINGQSMDHMSINEHHYPQNHLPPPVPPLPTINPNGYPVNYQIYGVHHAPPQGHPIYQSMQRSEPLVPFNPSLQGSMSSVNSGEKKRRNVTMV